MSTVTVRRTERPAPPELPRGEILLQSPPEIPEATSDSFRQTLMYLPMVAMMVGMGAMFAGNSSNKIVYVGGGAMALGMGGMMIAQMGRGSGERKSKLNGLRRDYLRYLGQVRRKVRTVAAAQREALEWVSPPPRALPALLVDPELRRIWERRPSGEDFAKVRIGTGTHRLAVRLVPPETKPVEDLDPLCAGALRRFVRAHNSVPGLPVGISLRSFARIAPTGEPEAVHGMLRAMIAQLAIFHSPDDVRISVCASRDRMGWWQWIKWLPHNMHPTDVDAAGPVRLMAPSLPHLEAMMGAELAARPQFTPGRSAALPFHVVILDGGEGVTESRLGTDGIEGAVTIDLSPAAAAAAPGTPAAPALRLNVTSGATEMLTRDRTGAETRSSVGFPDKLSLAEADALARQLAPLRLGTGGPVDDPLAADTTLTSLIGISSPFLLDVPALWRPRPPRGRLRVPIGSDADGQPVELDIKESAQGGMGPHGLVIGATGSGKSELLRTLVLGLALTHPSDVLNFVLVDFKGGATFLGLERLTHVSAVITNLADELPLVDRMRDALNGELVRRQELLRAAGNYASLRDYTRAREQGADLPPVPSLFVVIDEFSELLSARPEFIDVFVMIGRVGRSLGVHLLLASQRLEEGKLRGLDTQLSYRIGLRTFSAIESRVVLGVPDAYELPPQPGSAYLKFGTDDMTRFKAAYVSGPAATGPARTQRRMRPAIVPFGPGYIRPELAGDEPRPGQAGPDGPAGPARHAGPAGPCHRVRGKPARRRGRAARILRGRRAPDLAAPAGRAAHAGSAPPAAVDHAAVWMRGREPGLARQAPRGHRDRGPAGRAAPRPVLGGPVGGRRPRGRGRRAAQRQVHRAADPDLLAGAAAYAAGGPVLLPRFRRRVARRPDRAAARRRGGRPAGCDPRPAHGRRGAGRAGPPGEGIRRARHRVDRRVPEDARQRRDRRGPVRRRVPRRGRLADAAPGVRAARAGHHGDRGPGPGLWRARAGLGRQVVGVPARRPRSVRHPAGAAPG